MPRAIFNRDFHWNHPKRPFGFFAAKSDKPQSFTSEFIKAAVKAGAAKEVKPGKKAG